MEHSEPTKRRWSATQWLALLLMAGILVALLVAKLQEARERSRRASCASNLRALGLAYAMYADIYPYRCPVDGTRPTLVGSLRLFSSVVQSAKIFWCPSDRRLGCGPASRFDALSVSNISYSYVPNLIWQDHQPAILMVDRIDSTVKGSLWPENGNHRGVGGNVFFTDGHVEWDKRLPADLRDKDGREIVLSP